MKFSRRILILGGVLAGLAAAAFLTFISTPSPAPQQVSSRDLYSKELTISGAKIQLLAKSVTLEDAHGEWESGEYYFSGLTYNGEPFSTKVESMTTPEYDPETGIDPLLIQQDISGDESPEIIITVVKGNQTTAHEILWYDGTGLVSVVAQNPISGDQESQIDFDKIWYENGYAYTTSHGGDSRQETQYEFDKGWLIQRGGLNIRTAADTSDPDDCYIYLTLGKEKNEVQKETCNVWTEDLKPYWSMLYVSSYINAANELLKYVPRDDSAIDAIVDTYYDLTLHYGNASDNSIFDKSGKFDAEEFFRGLLPDASSWENRVVMQNGAFKRAFFAPGPSSDFELPLPLGPAIGGEIVGRKYLDEYTVLVYARYFTQAYLGPAAHECKEAGNNIDKWILKKMGGEWKVVEIDEMVDSWKTQNEGTTKEECRPLNEDKIEKYRNL